MHRQRKARNAHASGTEATLLVGPTLLRVGRAVALSDSVRNAAWHRLPVVRTMIHRGRATFVSGDSALPGEAAAVTRAVAFELEELRRERSRAVADERDRIAAELLDRIMQRLFAVGLSLHTTAALSIDETVDSRLRETIDSLDQTIAQIRTIAFDLASDDGLGTTGVPGPSGPSARS